MNKVFKVVWSKTKGMYVVVSELAKSHQNGTSKRIKGVVLSGLVGAFLLGAFGTADASLITTDESQMEINYNKTGQAYKQVGWDSGNGVQYKLLIQGATDGGVEVKMGSYMSGGDKKVSTKSQPGAAQIENKYQVLKIGLDAATLKKINDSSSNSQTALDELKNKANRDLDNLSEAGEKKLSDLVKGIKTGSTDLTAGSDNIKIAESENADGSKSFSVDLNKKVNLTADGSVSVGETKLDKSGLEIGGTKVGTNGIVVGTAALTPGGLAIGKTVVAADGLTVAGGPSVTTAGIDAGGKKVSNVGEGAVAEGSTDAVTGGQLFGVQKNLEDSISGVKDTANSALQSVTVTDSKGQELTIDKDNAGFGIVGATDGMVESKVSGQDLVVDLTDATKEKINNAAGKDLGNLDDKGKEVIKEVVQESVNVDGGDNISVVDATNDDGIKTFTVNLDKNIDLGTDGSVVVGDTKLDKSGLEIIDGPSVTKDGIDAGGKVVGNLGEGAVAEGSKDAVTGGQLFGVQKTLEDSVKGVKDTANSALQSVTVTDSKGQTLVVNKDNAGFGIKGATDGMVTSEVSGQDLVVDLTAATKEKINNAAGKDLGNLDDKGKTVIKEVVQESVDVASGNNIEVTDAVNNEGVKTFTVNMKNNVDLGATGSIKAGATTLDASGLTAGATKVGADGVSVGDAALTADGLAIIGGPSVTKDGINAGGKVVGNLGEGAVAEGSKDAVTGGQLFGVQKDLNDSIKGAQDTANSALQTVSVKDGAGKVLTVNKDNAGFGILGATDGMVESKVSGQDLVVDLTAATKEKINNAAGKDLGNLDDKGKDVIKEVVQNAVDVKGGTNINVDAANVNDVKTFTVNLDKNLDLGGEGSITLGDTIIKSGDVHVGDTTINNGGVTLNSNGEFKVGDTVINGSTINVGGTTLNQGGLTIKNGPTINVGGINMGGTKITNVANATEEGDVVTYNQLQEVKNIATEGSELANSALQTVAVKGNDGQTITISKGQANLGIVGATDGMVESKVSGQDLVVDLTAATKEKINNAAGKDLGNLDDKGKEVIKEVVQKSVDVKGGTNIEVASETGADDVKTFTVNMKNNVDLGADGSIKAGTTTVSADGVQAGETKLNESGLEVGETSVTTDGVSVGDAALTADGLAIVGGPFVTKDGINAGGKVVSNLGEGSVTEGSKDAVTGGQLYAVKTDVDGVKGRVDTINNNLEKVTNNLEKVTETAGSALQTVTVTDTKGQTLVVNKDNAGFGIKGATDGMVTSEVSGQDLVVDLTAATKEKINNAAGKDLGNLDDKGKTVIKEVVQNAVDVKGGTNINVDTADVNDVKTFTVNLNKAVDLGADGSISLGDTVINGNSVNVGGTTLNQGGLTINNGPSITVDGINAKNTKITNVVDGSQAGDVVTYNQLLEVRKIAENGSGTSGTALQTVSVKDTDGNAITVNKDNASFGIVAAADGMVESKVNGQNLVVDLNADTKAKINNAADKNLGNLGDGGKEVIREVAQDAVDVSGGNNIDVAEVNKDAGVKRFIINLENNVKLGDTGSITIGGTTVNAGGLTITDGPSVTKDGIDAGGKVVSNLGAGSVAEGSKDAVTGGQLFDVKTELDGKVNTITNNLEKVTETAGNALQSVTVTDTNGQKLTVNKDNAGFGIKGATDGMVTSSVVGQDLVVDLTDTTKEKINNAAGKDLGNLDDKGKEVIKEVVQKSVDVKGSDNIEVTSATGADDVKTFTVNMKNNVDLGANGSIKAGTTTVDANGLTAGTTTVSADGVQAGETKLNESGLEIGATAVTADGLAIVGGPSVTKDGINAGGKVVANLGEGAVTEGSKDAVTGGQLYGVKTDLDNKVNTVTNEVNTIKSDVGTLKTEVNTVKNDVGTLKTEVNTVKTDVGTLKTEMTTVKTDVGTIRTDVNTLTDRVTTVENTAGSALQTVTVKDSEGNKLTVNKENAGFGIVGATDGMVASKVAGQDLVVDLTDATKEKINNAAGKDLGNLDDKGKEVIKEVVQDSVDVLGGSNINVDKATVDGVKTFTVNLDKNLDLGGEGSITLGDTIIKSGDVHVGGTTINNGGVTLNSSGEFKVGDTVINGSTINVGGTTLNQGGLTIKNGPTIKVGGINMGGTKITNVANATEEGDVVTYNQLQEVKNIATEGSELANSALQTVSVKGNDGQTIAISKSNSAIGIVGATNGMVESKVIGNDLVVDLTNATKEKINNAAGKDLGNLDDKGKEVIKEVSQDAVDVVGGSNITVDTEKVDDVKTFTVNLNKDLNLGGEGSITLGDTVIKSGDVNIGGTTINQGGVTLVPTSEFKVGDTVINGGSINVAGTTINEGGITVNRGGITVNPQGTIVLGDTTISNGGFTIKNGPTINVGGINMGGTKITNVANGTQEGDVVTYNQLQEVKNIATEGSELANSALQTISINDGNGGVITVNKGQAGFGITGKSGGMVESKVDGQNLVVDLTAAAKEKINNAADKDLSNLSDKGKEVIKETSQNAVNVTGGNNITVNTSDVNGVKTFDVNLNNQIDLGTTGSVKAGNTTVDNNGVSVGSSTLTGDGLAVGNTKVSDSGLTVGDVAVSGNGLSITGGPSVTKEGIDAGNKVISNIADGVKAGDAVNKGQLDKVDAKVTDLSGRVDGLDTRVSGVEKGLSDLGNKVDGLGQDVKDLGNKVGNLDTKVGNLDTKVTDLDNTVKGFDGRLTDVENMAGSAIQGITVGSDTNNKEERVNLTKDKNRLDIVGATDHDGNKSIVTAVEGNKVTVDLTGTVKDKIDNAATKSLNNLDKDGKAVVRDLLRARGMNAVEVEATINSAGQKTFHIGLNDDALLMLTRNVGWGTPGVVTNNPSDETVEPEERSGFRLSDYDWKNNNGTGNPYDQTLAVSTDFKITDRGALDLADDVVIAKSLTIGDTAMTTDGIVVGGTTALTHDALTVQDSALTNDHLVIGGTTLATHDSETGLITLDNVAQGSISESSNQAITGAQLYPIKTQVDNNTAAIGVIGEVVNAQGQAIQGLSSEIQSVRNESAEGDAMAASLAALNPLPYAEGERGQIMAGVGTYKGKQAMAVGYAYAPNSNQQYTVGLSYGQGGKAMANMGATFRIGSGETTKPGSSVAAVQSKVQALEAQNKAQQAKFDEELAAKQSQIDAQNDRIAKLEALVQQLVQK